MLPLLPGVCFVHDQTGVMSTTQDVCTIRDVCMRLRPAERLDEHKMDDY